MGGFPRGFEGGVLDEDVVLVADEVVAVVRLWSPRRRGGLWGTEEGPWLRGRAQYAGSCE